MDAVALSQWLLPIEKTTAAEAAFEISSEAVRVYGGAGYVKDFPVEQLTPKIQLLEPLIRMSGAGKDML